MKEISPKEISPFTYPIRILVSLLATFLVSLALAGTASALTFTPATNFAVGHNDVSVAIGDLNGDSYADLAVANPFSDTVSVLLGDGTGSFGVATDFAVGNFPFSVAIRDLNGDSFPDLAVANYSSNDVSVLLGDGTGSLGPPSNFAAGGGPRSVAIGHLNGDSFPDLAVANGSSNDVSVLLGDGTGSFGPPSNFAVGTFPYSVAIGDLDGDSIADLAVANAYSNDVSVLLGDGTGLFSAATNFGAGGVRPYSVAIGDLNGDGLPDLAVANLVENYVSVLLGDGTGLFSAATNFGTGGLNAISVAIGDLNGDSFPDLAVANYSSNDVSVLLGDGTGSFGPPSNFAVGTLPLGTAPNFVAIGDLNGDSLPDLAAAIPNDRNVSILLNTTVVPRPDVAITKTATPTNPRPGDTVTYTLTAKNLGIAVAHDVVITDPLPAGVTFVSADAPCTQAMATVTCNIGSLNPGEEKSYEVKVTVDSWGAANPNIYHLLDVQRVEAQIDLNAGEQRTVSVSCPSGFIATDGSVRIDHIDQGTGDWPSPQVLESRASSLGTWQGTVKNTATGRAQAKIFAVCVRETTSPNGHNHNLIVSAPVTTTNAAPIGIHEATLQCGPGQVAIQPGFVSTAPADLVYSQPEGNGWKFKLDMKAAGDVTFSIRCLNRQLSMTNGHILDLKLERIWHEVTVEAGKVNEAQLTCADGSKGIVAGWDLDHGLLSLGNDPRPVTRAFKLYNPTDHPLTARLSLLCLGDRTGGEHAGPIDITNTAYISTSSNETVTGNNMSSATITAEDTNINTPVPEPPPVKPTPNNPIAMKIAGGDAFYSGSSVTTWINCSGACQGTAKLLTGRAMKAHGKKIKKGTVLAKGRFNLTKAGTSKIKLKVTARGRKLFRIRKMSRGLLTLTGGAGKPITIK